MMSLKLIFSACALLLLIPAGSWAFSPSCTSANPTSGLTATGHPHRRSRSVELRAFFGGGKKDEEDAGTGTGLTPLITDKRRQQLGIGDDEDEYDLGVALAANTDDTISKIVAGSLILVILGLLIAGVVIPSLTDYGEGVCSPIQNAGRC